MVKDKELIKECRDAWQKLSAFRRRRSRCKDFAYGRQWGDSVRLPSGRIVSEATQMYEAGRTPVTNNLIGRMIRQIVGYYRHLTGSGDGDHVSLESRPDAVMETDARSLEEFLISGMALQRVKGRRDGWLPGHDVSARSPERVFFRRFEEADGEDVRFIGMLHDVAVSSVLEHFGSRDCRRIGQILESATGSGGREAIPCVDTDIEFGRTDAEDLCRVVEVWRRRFMKILTLFDPITNTYLAGPCTVEAANNLRRINEEREQWSRPQVVANISYAEVWEQTWMLPDGLILQRNVCRGRQRPPIAIRLYPMLDGEVHSLVETVVDQQKFVNRLVGLLDEILGASAKGAVLYPVDQLPEGMTWEELRRLWASPSAILPFKRTSRSIQPRQISTGGSCSGATELLKTQLSLFDDISGSGGILSGSEKKATGAEMARLQRDSAQIAMLDTLAAFKAFTAARDRLRNANKKAETVPGYVNA